MESQPTNTATPQPPNKISYWAGFGNNPTIRNFWFNVGSSTIFLLPKLERGNNDYYHAWVAVATMFVTAWVYVYAAACIQKTWLRVRRSKWWQSALLNIAVSFITSCSSTMMKNNTNSVMIGQLFLAVAVFALMEMSKPIFDFGISQYYLRLPFQTALKLYNPAHEVVIWHIISGAVLVLGTFWQAYFLSTFEQEHKRQLTGKAVGETQIEPTRTLSSSSSPRHSISESPYQSSPAPSVPRTFQLPLDTSGSHSAHHHRRLSPSEPFRG